MESAVGLKPVAVIANCSMQTIIIVQPLGYFHVPITLAIKQVDFPRVPSGFSLIDRKCYIIYLWHVLSRTASNHFCQCWKNMQLIYWNLISEDSWVFKGSFTFMDKLSSWWHSFRKYPVSSIETDDLMIPTVLTINTCECKHDMIKHKDTTNVKNHAGLELEIDGIDDGLWRWQ